MPLSIDPHAPTSADGPAADPAAAVKGRFKSAFGSNAEQAPSPQKAIGQPLGEMRSGLERAERLRLTGPTPSFSADTRDRLGGKRNPDLPLAIELFARALQSSPQAAQATGVTPELLLNAVALDDATNRQIDVAELFLSGAENGDLMISSVLEQLAEQVLTTARQQILDPGVPPADRAALQVAFAAALRTFDNRRQQQQQAAAAVAGGASAEQQRLAQANAQAADERVLQAYFSLRDQARRSS